MAAITQISVFCIFIVTLFHFGYSNKYSDHGIEEFSKRIKSLIHPNEPRGRYPYDHKSPQIYFDDHSKPYNDEYFSRDKLEKTPSKEYSKNYDEKYGKSDKEENNGERDSKHDIKNESKEWYDKKDEKEASKEEKNKDDIKKEIKEGYDKEDEVKINKKEAYLGDEKAEISEHEPEVSSKEIGKPSHEIEISPSPLSLPDKYITKDISIDPIIKTLSTDIKYNEDLENPLSKIEEYVKPFLPENIQPNLFNNKDINIAPVKESLPLFPKFDEIKSTASIANLDPIVSINNKPSVFDNQNNGAIYNGFSNDKYSPYNNALPYPYDILGFSNPNVNSPPSFVSNNYFNNFFPSEIEINSNPSLNQEQYQPPQLSNVQVVFIPNFWPVFQTVDPYQQYARSGQVFQPSNQQYPYQNIPLKQNVNGIPGFVNKESIVPGIQNVPRWLWYNNQNMSVKGGQNYVEGKNDQPKFSTNVEGLDPRTNAPLSFSKDGVKIGNLKENKN